MTSRALRLLPLLIVVVTGTLPACVMVRSSVGFPLPPEVDVAAIEPGVSTRTDVVARFGPPEEWRAPAITDDSRGRNGPGLRVHEEREVFRRRRYTWAYETRRTDGVVLLPFVTLFSHLTTRLTEDRLVVTFDEQGRVEDVATWLEIGR